MIDVDMQKHAATELLPDERVLWAEKTDQKKRDAWVSKKIKSDKSDTLWLLAGALFFLSVGVFTFNFEKENVHSYTAIMAALPIFLLALICLFTAMLCAKSYFNKSTYHHQRLIGGYVLTDYRLLVFGLDYQFLSSLNASKVMKAQPFMRLENKFKWNTIALTISPVKGVFLRCAELYFLPDFKKSENQINAALKEHSNE